VLEISYLSAVLEPTNLPQKNTVEDLRAIGADVEVVRGDVACYADVERAVMTAKLPIGGIVHATMSMHVSLQFPSLQPVTLRS